jgi:hypothetical protein
MNFPYTGLENHPLGGPINAIVNQNWVSLAEWVNPASGLTGSQSTTTFTASAAVFTSDDVGATIRMADGTTDTIAAYVSATVVTMTTSRTVTSQAFELYRATAEAAKTTVARALIKRPRMVAADNAKIPVWDSTLGRFVMTDPAATIIRASNSDGDGTYHLTNAAAAIGDEFELTKTGIYLYIGTGVFIWETGAGDDCGLLVVDDTAAVLLTSPEVFMQSGGNTPITMAGCVTVSSAPRYLYTHAYNSGAAAGILRDYRASLVRIGAV